MEQRQEEQQRQLEQVGSAEMFEPVERSVTAEAPGAQAGFRAAFASPVKAS